MPSQFEKQLLESLQKSILKTFCSEHSVTLEYQDRYKIPSDLAQKVYELIDHGAVLNALRIKINDIVATKITHSMVEELTSDVKRVLSHEPTRLRLRMVVASEIDKIKVESARA